MSPVTQRPRRFVPTVVVAAGLILTVGIFAALWNLEQERARASFEGVARERLDALQSNIALTLNNLISVKAFLDASGDVDRATFARFAKVVLPGNQAIQALEWIPRVPQPFRPRYEEAARRDGFPSFQFTERRRGEIVRAADRGEYFPVFFVEPYAGNEKALGYDVASSPTRLEALQRSAATGKMIATSRVILVQETADQYGALVFCPLYRKGAGKQNPATPDPGALAGFALGVFRVADIVEKTGISHEAVSGLNIAIFDRDAKPGERLLYPKDAHFDRVQDLPQGFRTVRAVQVAGRTWEIAAYPSPAAFQPSHWSSWTVVLAGLLLTCLFVAQRVQHAGAEATLQRSEESARRLFATVPLPVWVCDLDTLEFLEVNQAAVEHYGYSREQFLKMKISDIQPPEQLERLPIRIQEIRQAKKFSWSWKHRTRDGRIIEAEISCHRIRYDGRLAALVVSKDVTLRKQLEMELRQSQKLEAVGSLAAGIAHEINTPIQFVGDNMRFLQGAFDDLEKLLGKYHQLQQAAAHGESAKQLAHEIAEAEKAADLEFVAQEIPKALAQSQEGVTRVATIVRAMKEFAHPNGSEKRATDLNKALRSTLTVARSEIKYVADVETDFQELPLVHCDGGDMNQVFLNLLVNAAHAIKDAGEGNRHRGIIRVCTRHTGDRAVISISDTGCGIPENIRAKIFEPFFTTKEVGRGTGQGLAIARTIVVERHGGQLTFESEPGRGTTFHISLPIGLE